MTVQELIDELQKVEDKGIMVYFEERLDKKPVEAVGVSDVYFNRGMGTVHKHPKHVTLSPRQHANLGPA